MELEASVANIAQEIQLSVAPVFLLTGIAGVLAVLSGRLGRVIDRARTVAAGSDEQSANGVLLGANALRRRIWLIQWAIRLYVVAALVICLVIVSLFLGDYVAPDLSLMIAILFILAMACMVVGLLMFLHEVGIATRQTRAEMDALLATDNGKRR